MAQINVISVNPSKQTLGALNIDSIEQMARICQPGEKSFSLPGLKSVCNFIFGVNKNIAPAISAKLALTRTLAAGLFVLASITSMPLEISGYSFNIAAFVIGGMILLGFFSRIAAFTGFAFTAFLTGMSIYNSLMVNYDIMMAFSNPSIMLSTVISFVLLAIAILGPGKLSIDQIMNKAIYKSISKSISARRVRRSERNAELRMSYKAWRTAR